MAIKGVVNKTSFSFLKASDLYFTLESVLIVLLMTIIPIFSFL